MCFCFALTLFVKFLPLFASILHQFEDLSIEEPRKSRGLKINVCVVDESRMERTMDKMGVDNGSKDGDPQVEVRQQLLGNDHDEKV